MIFCVILALLFSIVALVIALVSTNQFRSDGHGSYDGWRIPTVNKVHRMIAAAETRMRNEHAQDLNVQTAGINNWVMRLSTLMQYLQVRYITATSVEIPARMEKVKPTKKAR